MKIKKKQPLKDASLKTCRGYKRNKDEDKRLITSSKNEDIQENEIVN